MGSSTSSRRGHQHDHVEGELLAGVLERPPASDPPAVRPLVSVGIIILVGFAILYLLPKPGPVTIQGWRMFAIFVCTILALTLRPLPGGASVMIAVVVIMLSKVMTPAQAL